MCSFDARHLLTIKELTIGHTKIIMFLENPSEDDEQGHREAILDIPRQIFGSMVLVKHHSKALFNMHQWKRLPMNFEPA